MADNFVQVPPDSTGKRVRTQSYLIAGATVHHHYYTPCIEAGTSLEMTSGGQTGEKVMVVGDGDKFVFGTELHGTALATFRPVVIGGYSNSVAATPVTAGQVVHAWHDLYGRRQINGDAAMSPVLAAGPTAPDAAVSAYPVTVGGRVAQANPTPMSASGDVVNAMCDDLGRQVTVPHHVRDMLADTLVNLTSTTSVTDLLAADANNMNDILSITLVNTAGTNTQVILFDDDGTTKRWAGYVPSKDMRGIVFPVPLKQTAVNKKWKAQSVTAGATIKVGIQYVKNGA